MFTARHVRRCTAFLILSIGLATGGLLIAQTREKGPWWPSPHGAKDQAGNTNYITPEKVLKALRIPKTGQTYELGHIYEPDMPQYGNRPFYLITHMAPAPQKDGQGFAQQEYFTGYIVQMGTQYDAFGHQGRVVRMADGTEFAVGTGFSDAQRSSPPPVGSVVTFRYQELSDGGVPRFPSYVGVRVNAPPPDPAPAAGAKRKAPR